MSATARRVFPPAPTTPRALLLRAHPLPDSFNSALADAWQAGAESAGATVQTLDVHELRFDPALLMAHRESMPLEPDLQRVQRELAACAHLTIAYPVWWGSTPALLKGLFDRVLQPGWAYAMGAGVFPDKGLSGRTGRLLVTMDTPGWYASLVYGASARKQVQRATLHFVGIAPTRVDLFAPIEKTTPAQRDKMLKQAQAAGRKDGARLLARFPGQRQALGSNDC
ncbi:MAG: NAD(P)H-dependent oxidoreductase [Myxococcota bacterium]|nr:NAD(P)H-dependent oxidoreductase [Myxococcota bacterium]